MRNLSSLIAHKPSPKQPPERPSPSSRPRSGAGKDSTEAKPAPKRCLNEAAHKLYQ